MNVKLIIAAIALSVCTGTVTAHPRFLEPGRTVQLPELEQERFRACVMCCADLDASLSDEWAHLRAGIDGCVGGCLDFIETLRKIREIRKIRKTVEGLFGEDSN